MVALNLPATQGVHMLPSDPVWPLMQLQLDSALLPFADPEFAGQSMHVVVSVFEYVSALQTLQTSAVAAVDVEYLPGMH